MSSGEAPPANPAPSRPRGIPPHWEWESFEDRKHKRFPTRWVGDNPTIESWRFYMDLYLDWMLQGSVEDKQRVQRKAEEYAVNKFVQEGKTKVKHSLFEWAVDRSYWYTWFDPVYSIVDHLPPYPWGRPEEDPNEPNSETFASILAKRRNKEQEKQRQKRQRWGSKRQQSGSADEPQSRQLEAPAEERGTRSQSLDPISDMLLKMPVCDNERNPQRLVKVIPIGDDEQRVLFFQVASKRPSSRYNW